MPQSPTPLDELITVRDWLRYAVSRFNAAGLIYGHGTQTALDEAAFLILTTLNLPVDALDPWLEARLTYSERAAIDRAIELRISTRKPAPYIVNAAYIRGHRFYVDERTIVPRSFIGELLCDVIEGEADGLVGTPRVRVTRVLDLCTGGGSLAILAALAFPDARIIGTDISADALAVAQRNVADYKLGDRIQLVPSDLFAALAGKRFDLIVSNPPYVTDAAVAAFPPEYRTEPKLAHAGGADGMDFARRILAEAGNHLAPEGQIIMEIGQGREALESKGPKLPYLWLATEESSGEVLSLTAAQLAKPRRRGSS